MKLKMCISEGFNIWVIYGVLTNYGYSLSVSSEKENFKAIEHINNLFE